MLTEKDVADCVMCLIRAGKQPPRITANESAESILKATVDLWYRIFKNCGKQEWEAATDYALTMTECKQINVNMLSPALMQEALKRKGEERLQELQTVHEQVKQEPVISEDASEAIKELWRWSYGALANRGEKLAYMPDEEELLRFKASWNISNEVWNNQPNMSLIKTQICDIKFCQANNLAVPRKMFVNESGRIFFQSAL